AGTWDASCRSRARPARSSRRASRAPTRCRPPMRSTRCSGGPSVSDVISRLTTLRASDPDAVASAYAKRERGMLSFPRKLFLIAADHPGRGVLAAGGDPRAMADRGTFLDRLVTALAHPEVDGVLGTADIVDDLALLG